MLEQEIASIIKITLNGAGNPSPYYDDVPESFSVPAAFFPQPEISTRGETFRTYAMEYAWYIKFFHKTQGEAYALALAALTEIKRRRNLVPIIDGAGKETGAFLRVDDPSVSCSAQSLKDKEIGSATLKLYWTSRRPYDADSVPKMQSFHLAEELK